ELYCNDKYNKTIFLLYCGTDFCCEGKKPLKQLLLPLATCSERVSSFSFWSCSWSLTDLGIVAAVDDDAPVYEKLSSWSLGLLLLYSF
nr:hypothetical protein [Tanacetum cinerariifolium]